MTHIGIDYGAKLAGTTAICYLQDKQLQFAQSVRQKDADAFVAEWIPNLKPSAIYLDAPLSLPLAYLGKGEDFFFRKCDSELKAMSPMFLGGLTARAMQLKSRFSDYKFHETYPAALAKMISESADRKWKQSHENFEPFVELLLDFLPYSFAVTPDNWHQVDASLAWLSGHRHDKGDVIIVGRLDEGLILY